MVVEEILHFTIACNLMNALSGKPAIDNSQFVPEYTGELPFGIGYHFTVHLKKCAVRISATIEFASVFGSLYQAFPLQIR